MHRRWIALVIALTFSGMTQAHDTPHTAAPATQAGADDDR